MTDPASWFCIDIDNVIAQTDQVVRRVIATLTKGRVRLEYEDIVEFNYYECEDEQRNRISKKEWIQVHDLFSEPRCLRGIEPMPGAIYGLRRLAKRGTIHLATSRLRKARKATVEWLDKHAFPDHDLHFLKHREKHASLQRFAAAVEDDYEQAKEFAKSGTPCFLIRHPWNKTKPPIKNIEWVDDWKELTKRLLRLVP